MSKPAIPWPLVCSEYAAAADDDDDDDGAGDGDGDGDGDDNDDNDDVIYAAQLKQMMHV
jgi:hypothetical protein